MDDFTNPVEREHYLLIDETINNEKISHAARIAQLKIVMNNIDDIRIFRINDAKESEVTEFEKKVHKIYIDLIKIEDEPQRLNQGVYAATDLKEIKKALNKIISTTTDDRVLSKSKSILYIADAYLSLVFTYVCGIEF